MSPVPAAALPTALEGTFLCVLSCPRAAAPPWSARALGLGKTAPYGARKGRATVREPQPEAEVQQFAESRGSEASPSPTPGQDTAMDLGQGWTRGNSGSVQRAARGRRVADKDSSKELETQKSSPGGWA